MTDNFKTRLEDTLSRSELLFGRLWDISVDGMRIIDGDGIIIMVNESYCRMVERTKEQLIGKPFSFVYHQSEQKEVQKIYQYDALNDEIKTRFERENTLWNGKRRWFEFSNSFLNIPDSGKITLSIIKDITERKRSELDLIESEKKFRLLFNNANDGVFVTQLTEDKTYGDFIEVNEIACNRLGYTKEEFLKLSPSAIVSPRFIDEFNKSINTLLKENHVIYEVVHRAKDKKLIPTEVSSHLFQLDNKITVLSIARDITERKHSEEMLKKTSTMLRNLASHLQTIREDERTLLARELHDEFGQVLTALKIQISLLSKKLRDDQQDLKDKIFSITGMIDDTVEKVQSISARLRPGMLDELGLIPSLEWQAQEFEKHSGIRCSLSLPSVDFKLDNEKSTALFRIFQEALTNILRHASANKVYVSFHKEGNFLCLEIKDNGIGISDFQLKNPKSLGLIGMNERALILGGEVTIEGIPEIGTSVKVTIPIPQGTN